MAVDTENKRRSVAHVLPVPDGIINSPDYQQVAGLYAGINAYVAAGPVSRRYNVPADDRVYNVRTEYEQVYNVPSEDRVFQVKL